jgi:hypothetical protein
MLQFSLPPGYERKTPVVRPKLGPWLGIVNSPRWPPPLEFSEDLINVVTELGVVAALRKPVNRDELLHTIRKVLKS